MICPNCNKNIDDDSRFCRFCGVEFIGEETVIDIEPEEPEQVVEKVASKKQKKNIIKLCIALMVTIVVAVTVILAVTSIGDSDSGDGNTLKKETVTDAEGKEYKEGWGNTTISVKDTDGTVREIKTDKSYLSASSILAEYTAVMNQLKNDSPAFSKIRYQNLPTEHQNLGGLGGLVLPIIEKYVTSKSAANAVDYVAGNSDKLPVIDSSYGCILTDSEKIKNAYCEILDDGMYKLVITVVDELNPEIVPYGTTSTQSAISGIFDPYNALEQITAISSLALSEINFNYTDCTVTIIYDYKTKHVQSLNQTMNIDITANAHIAELKARIVDITEYTQFKY
ncbi:MAG: zinc ribbon domain-containing protein [Clostridia bacterium]|nr:zinc ribbon domain-containing protein [Clostridia bacterium]